MNILFLNLASNSTLPGEGACIACVSDTKTEAIRFTDHRLADDKLMPELEMVMSEAGWDNKDLTHIASITGPGGFTSLRVAVTLANTYSDQLQIPVVGVNLSDLYCARTSPTLNPSPDGEGLFVLPAPRGGRAGEGGGLLAHEAASSKSSFVWLHSTKKTHLFIRGFDDLSSRWPEPTLISLDDLVSQLPENTSIVGEILPEHREAVAAKNPAYPTISPIADVLPAFLSSLPYDHKALAPWYGRGW